MDKRIHKSNFFFCDNVLPASTKMMKEKHKYLDKKNCEFRQGVYLTIEAYHS